jgi:hypothetical protein
MSLFESTEWTHPGIGPGEKLAERIFIAWKMRKLQGDDYRRAVCLLRKTTPTGFVYLAWLLHRNATQNVPLTLKLRE